MESGLGPGNMENQPNGYHIFDPYKGKKGKGT